MAIVRVELFPRSQAQREAIIEGITEVLIANGAKAEGTQLLLHEVLPTHWGRGGSRMQSARVFTNGHPT